LQGQTALSGGADRIRDPQQQHDPPLPASAGRNVRKYRIDAQLLPRHAAQMAHFANAIARDQSSPPARRTEFA
jgi:hypothetical protein